MKVQDILYENTFTGFVGRCYPALADKLSYVRIGSLRISIVEVARAILLTGKYRQSYSFEMRGERFWAECSIRLEAQTDRYLLLAVYDTPPYGQAESVLVGRIRVEKGSIIIEEEEGQGLIRIFDVGYLAGTTVSNFILGEVAVGLGVYLLGVFDGEWDRLVSKETTSITERLREMYLGKETEVDRAESDAMITSLLEEVDRLEVQQQIVMTRCQDLECELTQKEGEIESLASQLVQAEALVQELYARIEATTQAERSQWERLQEIVADTKFAVVGGSEAWRKRFTAPFPHAKRLDHLLYTSQVLEGARFLVINSQSTGHSSTRQAKGWAESKGIPVIFVDTYNLEHVSAKILQDMGYDM